MSFRRLRFSLVAIASLWLLGLSPSALANPESGRIGQFLAPSSLAVSKSLSSVSGGLNMDPIPNDISVGNNNPVKKPFQYSKSRQNQSKLLPKNKLNRKRSRKYKNKLDCQPTSQPIWLMNQCHQGFVAVLPDRRVVTLDKYDPHDTLGKEFFIDLTKVQTLKMLIL